MNGEAQDKSVFHGWGGYQYGGGIVTILVVLVFLRLLGII